MSKKVTCVSSEVTLNEVIRLMRQEDCPCLIVAEKNMPVGVITERDLFPVLADRIDQPDSEILCASEIMSSPPVVLNLSATLFKALAIARSRIIRHFPVVNTGGEVVGLVTETDLVRAHFRVIESQREIIERAVITRTEELQKANYELKELALEDVSLGIGNRRAMEVDLQHTHETVLRYNRSYSVVLFDIDYFKEYNDSYGKSEGDNALREVACYLKGLIRQADRLYRYEDATFLLLLPETACEQADVLARRIIGSLADLAIPNCESPLKILTLSGGTASEEFGMAGKNSWEEVISEAARGLTRAKLNGRNQIEAEKREVNAGMAEGEA
ncbi:MAG: diguanylate cyclase [Nitrospira sp.]|nr:GGDEF domain-containing protein [Candidatus Manganitrophaceae bacterium]HIL35653.1 GGDEF domain-containing protein [Candidatus Manganitrophaceae bacterium]